MSETSPPQLHPQLQKKVEAIQDQTSPVLVIGSDFRIKGANKKLLGPFGIHLDNLVGNSAFSVLKQFSPDDSDRESRHRIIRNVIQKAESETPEQTLVTDDIKIKTPDGKFRWIRLRPKFIEYQKDQNHIQKITKYIKTGLTKLLKKPQSQYDSDELEVYKNEIKRVGMQIEVLDVTEAKRIEALLEANQIINNEKLDLNAILSKVEQVLNTIVPHDTANIMLFDGENKLRVTNKWGYGDNGPEALAKTETHDNLDNKPKLKQMIDDKMPLYVSDTTSPDSGYIQTSHSSKNRSWAGAPIVDVEGKVLGFLNLNSVIANKYSQEDADLLGKFAKTVSSAIQHAITHEEVRDQSLRDPLTGLFNRRFMDTVLKKEFARSQHALFNSDPYQTHLPLSLLILDIDHFKNYNDAHGHTAGDEVLRAVAIELSKHVREGDYACRFGGEEFVLILTEMEAETVFNRAEEIREAIAELKISQDGKDLSSVTVSGGVTTHRASVTSSDLLFRAADRALYNAKKRGRNQIVRAWSEQDSEEKPIEME